MVDEEPLCGYDKLPLNRVLILMYYLFIYLFIYPFIRKRDRHATNLHFPTRMM